MDGAPLDSIAPPSAICNMGFPSEGYANGLRLYQQERYPEAVARFEHEVSGGEDPEWPTWWHTARFFLAKSYAHAERDAEANAVFLEIVRTADDPYRRSAAGWLCGDRRPIPPNDPAQYAACPDFEYEPWTVVAAGPIPPPNALPVGATRGPTPPRPYGSAVHRAMHWAAGTIRACPVEERTSLSLEYEFFSDGSVRSVSVDVSAGPPIGGTPVESCALEAARRVRLPPFTEPTFRTGGFVILP